MSAQRIQKGLIFLLIVASLGLWGYTGLHPHEVSPLLLHGAYYAVFTLFFSWLFALARYLQFRQFSITGFLRQYRWGILFCLAAALMIEGSVHPSFKTLGDETNLLLTSRAMAFERTVANEMLGVRYFGNFNPIGFGIDQRPFLFPFLTSLVHTILGFNPSNPFRLNALFMVIFLTTAFIVARQVLNGPLSAAAVFAVISYPIFSICGTSGGFDLVSCTFFGFCLILLFSFLRAPSSEGFTLLWATLLMFAYTRYESIVFFFIFLGYVVFLRQVQKSYFSRARLLIVMTPLWLLPLVWTPLVNSDYINDPTVQHLFAPSHFYHHLQELMECQTNFQFILPFNTVWNWLAFLVMGCLAVEIFVRKKIFQKPEQYRFALIFTVSILLSLTVVLSHFAGYYTRPTQARYFLPFSVLCAVIPFFWLATWSKEILDKFSIPILLGTIGFFLLYHPLAVEGRFINSLPPNRDVYFAHEMIERQFPDKRIMIITEIPSEFTALEYGAVDFDFANAKAPLVLSRLQRHLYQDILVIQHITYATQAPPPGERLSSAYPLETLTEYETSDDSFLRISRVRQ